MGPLRGLRNRKIISAGKKDTGEDANSGSEQEKNDIDRDNFKRIR